MERRPILVVTLDAEWSLAPEAPTLLGALGHPVAVAPHGPSCLVTLATCSPSIVVVEVLDLDRHGTAFARIVRDRPSFERLPLIALTQDVPLRTQAALLLAGYDRVLPSPVPAGALARAVVAQLQRPERVPGLLEAYGRAAAIAVGHAAHAAAQLAQARTVS